MKKKHKICYVLAIIFTVLVLLCAAMLAGWITSLYGSDGALASADGEDAHVYGVLLIMAIFGMFVLAVLVHLFFFSFGGVVTSAVNFNCPEKKRRIASRIMLGVNAVFMAVSFGLILASVLS